MKVYFRYMKYGVWALFLVLVSSCAEHGGRTEIKERKQIVREDFKILLDTLGLEGSILVYDPQVDTYYSNDFEEAHRGTLPASTFKIVHTMIGLELGVLEDQESEFLWDGSPRAFQAWEQDLTLTQAFRYSCVPCYQELARSIGDKDMNRYLDTLGYSGMDVQASNVDQFWLVGTSHISPFQQIDFLSRFYNGKLPIQESTTHILKEILVEKAEGDMILSGKTGLVVGEKELGWYVGYQEVGDKLLYFAARIASKERDHSRREIMAYRKRVVLEALKRLGEG